MLQFLETGKALYVLTAICLMGVLSRFMARSLYKRLIKETGNMALTKNKNLKSLKQKTENMFLINHGIRNTTAYIEKQIYGFRFMKISLDHWDNLSMQAMILSFLLGGAAAFASYWFRSDSYYIVLYGAAGIMAGLFMVFVDNGANIATKRQQLSDCLVDYVENSPHFYKNVDKMTNSVDMIKDGKPSALSVSKPRIREIRRETRKELDEIAAGEEDELMSDRRESAERTSRFHIDKKNTGDRSEGMGQDKGVKVQAEHQNSRLSVLPRKKDSKQERVVSNASLEKEPVSQDEDELAKSIEYLRESLEQIAVSRDGSRRELTRSQEKSAAGRTKKELQPEELKLLGEILQEYFS